MSTKRHVIVFAFLIGCSTALAQAPQDVEDGKPVRLGGGGVGWKYVDEAWFAKQSKDLLDIIRSCTRVAKQRLMTWKRHKQKWNLTSRSSAALR